MSGAPIFERLAVVGMGLLGGSVALGARARGLAAEIRGVDPGRTDAGPIPLTSLEDAAGWADALVLAVPVEAFEAVLTDLAPRIGPNTILTDTASVKGPLAEAARRLLPHPENCIGAHPMAGGEGRGFEAARADLFDSAACILALNGGEPGPVVDRVEQFWQGLGTFTVRKTPDEHDAIVAVLSHAPHAVAYAFASGLPGPENLRLAGQGLRDFIRIARANPQLWCEILFMNRALVAEEMGQFEKNLGGILDALRHGDRAALERALRKGHEAARELEKLTTQFSGRK